MADAKWSHFPSESPDNADEIVGLHSGHNARFSVANFILAVRQGIAALFVPVTRTINNKALSSDITLTASDVGAYVKPSGGIPSSDMASAVQTSLGKADTAYQKPSGGIPLSDLASGIAPYVNYSSRIHTLSGYNASWQATQNCYCVAQIGSSGNTVAAVYVDGNQVLGTAQVSTAYYTYPYIGTFYVKQGQTVSTKDVSGQNYALNFYALY